MGKRFEIGKSYEAEDRGISPITVTGRTAHYVIVVNEYGNAWRMKIREDNKGEYAIDLSVGRKWSDAYTYRAMWEV